MDSSQPAKKAKLETPRAEAPFRGFVDLQVCMQIYAWFGCCVKRSISYWNFLCSYFHRQSPPTPTQINGWGGVDFSGSRLTEENAAKAFDDVRLHASLPMHPSLYLFPSYYFLSRSKFAIYITHRSFTRAHNLLFTLPIARLHVHSLVYHLRSAYTLLLILLIALHILLLLY